MTYTPACASGSDTDSRFSSRMQPSVSLRPLSEPRPLTSEACPPSSAFPLPTSAFLLLGPTGSGKTPLGEYLGLHGYSGRRCVHFDFGACLRDAASGGPCATCLSGEDLVVVKAVLGSGALLEDGQFAIAERLLRGRLAAEGGDGGALVVLNGLPRHAGQARMLEPSVTVRLVVHLQCDAEVVLERIRLNSGGDRAGRIDDSLEAVRVKLRTFEARTMPLLDHYAAKGVTIAPLAVSVTGTPADMAATLERKYGWNYGDSNQRH
jgi:adenylate kinase